MARGQGRAERVAAEGGIVALRKFVAEARSALEFTKTSLSVTEAAQTFAYGGLSELEEALTKIEEFLARPRFRDGHPSDARDC